MKLTLPPSASSAGSELGVLPYWSQRSGVKQTFQSTCARNSGPQDCYLRIEVALAWLRIPQKMNNL